MINALFWTFVLLLLFPLLKVLQHPERIYRYPYFMAAVFGIFILPQAVSLVRFAGAASEQAVQNVLLMTCLCLAGCLSGYYLAINREPRQVSQLLDQDRLWYAGLAFVGCGLVFSYVLANTEIETNEFGGWTGSATIYGFFQQLCYPGFAICLIVALRRADLLSIGSTLLAAIVPIQSMIFGRREPAVLFLLTIGLTFYFQWGLKPARWVVATVLTVALLAIPATATYRRFQLQNDWQAVRQIDLSGNFKNFLNEESVLELRNAAMLIEATRRSGDFEWGAGYWNHLVFRYIPAQLLGQRFKEALMIQSSREGLERELAGMDYTNPPGSTVTGMGDSFQQFGYGGCLFFFGLGMLFRNLWRAATPQNALFAQLLYMQSCTCAMRAVTHWTLDLLPGLIYNLLFLGAAALYATAGKPSTQAHRTRHRSTRERVHARDRAAVATRSNRSEQSPAPMFGTSFSQHSGNNENQ